MSHAVLDRSHEWIRTITDKAIDGSGTPEQRLHHMLREIATFYQGD